MTTLSDEDRTMICEKGALFGRSCLLHPEEAVPGLLQRAADIVNRGLRETGSAHAEAERAAQVFVGAAMEEWERLRRHLGGQPIGTA